MRVPASPQFYQQLWRLLLLAADNLVKGERLDMPTGDKDKCTEKQKRQAEHIEEGDEKRGVSEEEAERRAWARRFIICIQCELTRYGTSS
jgi:hypothetical protein